MSQIKWDFELFVGLLRRSANAKALCAGKHIHDLIIRSSDASSLLLQNLLVLLYRKCGALNEARAVFSRIQQRNLFSWNIMIGAYAENGRRKDSLELFQQMYVESMAPDKVTFSTALSICTHECALIEGFCIHHIAIHSGHDFHVVVGTALLDMYAKCGSLENAWKTFNTMPDRNILSWNAMLAAYAYHDQFKELRQLLHQMQLENFLPDKVTYITAIAACAKQKVLLVGKRLYVSVVNSMFEADGVLQNALLNLYGRCGCKDDASRLFSKLPWKSFVSWNAMIAACAQFEQVDETLALFAQMQVEGVLPDEFTYPTVFSAFTTKGVQDEGKRMHARVAGSMFELDIVLVTAVISMYGKCSSVDDARMMFNKMGKADTGVWNAMAMAYAGHGHSEEAAKVFKGMLLRGLFPDKVSFLTILSVCSDQADIAQGKWIHEHITRSEVVLDMAVGNALIDMYGKCGSVEDAFSIFTTMHERDVVSWSTMINAYTQNGQVREAFQLYEQMILSGVPPDRVVFLGILSACASEITLGHGKQIHHCILNDAFDSEETVQTALVCIYSKCGSLEDAQNMFDKLFSRNLVMWNSMIGVYTQHGLGVEALILFDKMLQEGVMPDEISFFSVLSACSHAGLLREGNCCFFSMMKDYKITPKVEHFNCMIDLLGRAGQLDDVKELVERMPLHPSSASWLSLLGACKLHVDMERGKDAADQAFALDPTNATPYVMLSNVYAAGGEW